MDTQIVNTQSSLAEHEKPQDLFKGFINKVPEITLSFWLIKMMSTTVGETGADYLIFNFGLGLPVTSAIMAVIFAVVLYIQMASKHYIPWKYWLTVVMMSILGTLITDNLTDNLSVPLIASTATFTALLIGVFGVWHAREQTLSIHHIDTLSREGFYWIAILVTFALGTAAGDWFAEGLNLGYGIAAAVFGGAIALIAAARFGLKASSVLCFWLAYILTRPLGAAIGDLLSQPTTHGGLGVGTSLISLIFILAIMVLVVRETIDLNNKNQAV